MLWLRRSNNRKKVNENVILELIHDGNYSNVWMKKFISRGAN